MSPGALLDTHILIWWRQGSGKLSKPQAQLLAELERRGEPAFISAITLWELAKMVERGRLDIDQPLDLWLEEIENHPLTTVVPITPRIVAESVALGENFQRGFAGQIIVATARCLGLRLLTADERIHRWGKVLWL